MASQYALFYIVTVGISLAVVVGIVTSSTPLILLPALLPVVVGLLLTFMPARVLRQLSLYRRYEAWSWRNRVIKRVVVFLSGERAYCEGLALYQAGENAKNDDSSGESG